MTPKLLPVVARPVCPNCGALCRSNGTRNGVPLWRCYGCGTCPGPRTLGPDSPALGPGRAGRVRPLYLEDELLRAVDRHAEALAKDSGQDVSRSAAVRDLVRLGLTALRVRGARKQESDLVPVDEAELGGESGARSP